MCCVLSFFFAFLLRSASVVFNVSQTNEQSRCECSEWNGKNRATTMLAVRTERKITLRRWLGYLWSFIVCISLKLFPSLIARNANDQRRLITKVIEAFCCFLSHCMSCYEQSPNCSKRFLEFWFHGIFHNYLYLWSFAWIFPWNMPHSNGNYKIENGEISLNVLF